MKNQICQNCEVRADIFATIAKRNGWDTNFKNGLCRCCLPMTDWTLPEIIEAMRQPIITEQKPNESGEVIIF